MEVVTVRTGWGRALLPASSVVLLALLMVMCSRANADVIDLPLCAEKHGFAGEFNDHYTIAVEKAPAAGEAVILVARAFPLNFGNLLAQWLYLNVTYRISEGAQLTKTSDNNGILELANVAAGTNIEVRVVRVRSDGPVPFRFFSFYANNPACHVEVAPENSFVAPVPHKLSAAPQPPLTMYFKTVLPPTVNALIVHISADGRTAQQFSTADKVYTSGDLVPAGSGGAVLFAYSPPLESMGLPYCFTTVSVSYGDWQEGDSTRPSVQPTSNSSGDSSASKPPTSKSMSVLRRLLWGFLLMFLVYQAAVSAYNYCVLGERDVMNILPCAESVTTGARTVRLATLRGIGVAQCNKEGYNSLQNPDDPYA
ncbi:conserved hypothetical protein [Leishmania braziliensis MHOM/BR/75/M2904]|uniref:Uncharacterized protein n=2 Tax=Leishmania braziliensis TaxID=5660 RepID=A4HIK0_LEIBR|nr:conserved hypothetical protein [Leishmania braziliensis MHOM/BR/75/M2904]KAI5689844.1 hypothetical protein MNV84_06019 [Leishmania braziliensis]CAJ2477341.1 unnamed protein product [Leishmania braziliensis]CAJ2477825.1 unnamed protein product [Leishmania braziliensis]CAM40413.1 conserved hypothetical protein [Leishmania braziliensis MHOM/BR/75/M2904]SYZ68090.1 hypothetical_protein [Leishmania braziliensis MHOM/BR/75/M2904]